MLSKANMSIGFRILPRSLYPNNSQAEETEKRLRKEAEDEARRAAQRAERAAAAREYQEADWILNSEAPDSASDQEEPELHSFECELCDKRFKSEAAFVNHKRCAVSPWPQALKKMCVPPRHEGIGHSPYLGL